MKGESLYCHCIDCIDKNEKTLAATVQTFGAMGYYSISFNGNGAFPVC
jgi:hypothetical protein